MNVRNYWFGKNLSDVKRMCMSHQIVYFTQAKPMPMRKRFAQIVLTWSKPLTFYYTPKSSIHSLHNAESPARTLFGWFLDKTLTQTVMRTLLCCPWRSTPCALWLLWSFEDTVDLRLKNFKFSLSTACMCPDSTWSKMWTGTRIIILDRLMTWMCHREVAPERLPFSAIIFYSLIHIYIYEYTLDITVHSDSDSKE